MTTPKKIFLINNKTKEPEFEKTFALKAKEHKYSLTSGSSLDFGFFFNRKSGLNELYFNNKKINPKDFHWFIRRWSPSEDATALLSLFLNLSNVKHMDGTVNSNHEIRTSKLSQSFQLSMHDCHTPSTFVCSLKSFNKYEGLATKKLGFPIVVKARGGLGKRVWKCSNKTQLRRKISELRNEEKDDMVILQEMVENDGDIRVFVFKSKVIATVKRHNENDFLNNLSQGGVTKSAAITSIEQKLAIRAAKALSLDLAGVDLVRTKSETLMFEVNKAPDILCFNEAVGFDISEKIFERFIDTI